MEITKRIAINTAIEEKVIKNVIEHSMSAILRNSKDCESVEMTGFGTFYLKTNRIPLYVINTDKQIEKFKVHLTKLTNKKAISDLIKRIAVYEENLIKIKKRYGLE